MSSPPPRIHQRTPGLSIVGLGCSSFSTFFDDEPSSSSSSSQEELLLVNDRSHTLHPPRVREWIATIHFAVREAGITLLDTAPWYGHGTSEVVVGLALAELLGDAVVARSSLQINTKVGRYEADPYRQFDYTKATTLESIQRSLKRLGIDSIDVLQLHDPEFAPSLDDVILTQTIPAMLQAQSYGWCRRLGMTGYPLAVQHQILVKSMHLFGRNIWDQSLVYSHFNLHDTSLLEARPFFGSTTSGGGEAMSFADHCQANHIALVTAAPLSMGLLTQSGPPSWHPASDELKRTCRRAAQLCADEGVDLATLALLFALSHPRIPCTILGIKNVEQVQIVQNVAARVARVTDKTQSQEEILDQILTIPEKKVYELLRDPVKGPFAQVWKNGNYQWDGVQGARDFWKQIGVDQEPWQASAHS